MNVAANNLQILRTETSGTPDSAGLMPDEETRSLYELWTASYEAELAGEITQALEIHLQVLSRIGTSYAAILRAGWLHFQAGGYSQSLHYYIQALLLSPGERSPLCGLIRCHLAMGNKAAAARAARVLDAVDVPARPLDHPIAV
jgi:tetratricopeptide (TPR) repeat protein